MKKYILTIFFCFALYAATAQTLNIKTGATFSKMSWTNSMASNTLFDKEYFGFITTFGVDYLQKKFFMLSSNIGYVNIGGNGTVLAVDPIHPMNDKMIDIRTTLHFFTSNTLALFKFKIGKSISPFIGFGPRLDYLVKYKEDAGLLVQFDDIKNLNKMQYGFIGVAGINYNMNKFRIGLEFQYNYTFTKLVNFTSQWNVKNELSVRYYNVAASIGYKIK